jgi:hypothetical protein
MNVAGFRGDRIKVKPSLIVITYNSESQRKVLGRGSESQPTELAALSTDRYDLQKLQVEQIRREME